MNQDNSSFPPPPQQPYGSQPPAQPYGEEPPAFGQAPAYTAAPAADNQDGAPGPQPGATPTIAVVGLILAFVFWPAGLVVSIMSLKRTRPPAKGRGLAIAGVIVSSLSLVATIVAVILIVFVARTVGEPAVAVTNLNTAFDTGDCDLYLASTTADYQAGVAPDCAAFDEIVAVGEGVYDDYRTVVTDVKVDGDTATVTTTETYMEIATGEDVSGEWAYTVVNEGGDWLVDVASNE